MNARCAASVVCFALGLWPVAVKAADPPAVAAVRQYLVARAARNYARAYALLLFREDRKITEKGYAEGDSLSDDDISKSSALLFDTSVLFFDSHNVNHYTFTIIGPDPAIPGTVLVRAVAPRHSGTLHPILLHVQVVADAAHRPRLDVTKSIQINAPELAKANAKFEQDLGLMESRNQLTYLADAIERYTQLHDDRLPDAGHWMDEIAPYLPNQTYFHDISDPASRKYSYAYNSALSHQLLHALDDPDSIVMVFETTKNSRNASDTGQSVPHPGKHESGTNCVFASGLVQWQKDGTPLSFAVSAHAEPPDAASSRLQSQAHLELIGQAIGGYEQDHDLKLPDAAHWVDEIMPYLKSAIPFRDPAAPSGRVYSYAFNRALSHQSLTQLYNPSTTVVVFESTKGIKNASDTGQSVPHPGRYEGGTDYLFADGHTDWRPDGTLPSFKLSGK